MPRSSFGENARVSCFTCSGETYGISPRRIIALRYPGPSSPILRPTDVPMFAWYFRVPNELYGEAEQGLPGILRLLVTEHDDHRVEAPRRVRGTNDPPLMASPRTGPRSLFASMRLTVRLPNDPCDLQGVGVSAPPRPHGEVEAAMPAL